MLRLELRLGGAPPNACTSRFALYGPYCKISNVLMLRLHVGNAVSGNPDSLDSLTIVCKRRDHPG
jgi:hypothetical protein